LTFLVSGRIIEATIFVIYRVGILYNVLRITYIVKISRWSLVSGI